MTQPDPAALDAMLTADAVSIRDACLGIRKRWQYVQALGAGVVGEDRFASFNHLATVEQLYFGQAAQPEAFDFDDALALARKGQ